uniref:Uncharacterized protein n=1 Tax=Lactuca sativa TaxID=4236 RepID=A0A9R1WBF0_LACSA|nr:hypothetical protein LSAT_V11C300115340 [Lactuca sativa]
MDLNKYSEWEAQVVQHTQKLAELIIELLIEDHPPKSRRGNTVPMQVLAYWTSTNAHDEYLRMSEIVIRDVVIKFLEEYLRRLNEADLARLVRIRSNEALILCTGYGKIAPPLRLENMHVEAVNQQSFWKPLHFMTYGYGMNSFEHQVYAMTLTSSADLLFLMMPNTHRSYVMNIRETNMAYYPTDDIYPSWDAFFKSITPPNFRNKSCLLNIKRPLKTMLN